MAVPHERLEALEPSNLLEPMDLTDTRPNDADAYSSSDRRSR
jgi:hypothetical protein